MQTLTDKEYLQLINNSLQQGKAEQALTLAEQAIAAYPEKGELIHYCATVFADEGQVDRAKLIVEQAIPVMANAYPAVLFLGFLHITSGDVNRAKKAWQGLDTLAANHAFNLLRQGLLHLVVDEFVEARQCLQAGIAANTELPSINGGLRPLLVKIDQALTGRQ